MDAQAEFERSTRGGVGFVVTLVVVKMVGLWFTMIGPTVKGAWMMGTGF